MKKLLLTILLTTFLVSCKTSKIPSQIIFECESYNFQKSIDHYNQYGYKFYNAWNKNDSTFMVIMKR